jgi:Holliday junction resolvase
MGVKSAGGPPLESKVTKAIMAYLEGRGIWCFKVAGGPMQQRGVPDIICSVNGMFVALEVKRPRLGRLTDLQALTIERIRESGGVAEVVTSVEEAAAVIDGLAERPNVVVCWECKKQPRCDRSMHFTTGGNTPLRYYGFVNYCSQGERVASDETKDRGS